MQHEDKKPDDAGRETALNEDALGQASSAAERDASALARLLIYAVAQARELGSEDAAVKIEEAVESVKQTFSLTDSDILPTKTFINH